MKRRAVESYRKFYSHSSVQIWAGCRTNNSDFRFSLGCKHPYHSDYDSYYNSITIVKTTLYKTQINYHKWLMKWIPSQIKPDIDYFKII